MVQEQLKGSGASEDVEVELLATQGRIFLCRDGRGRRKRSHADFRSGRFAEFDGVMTDQEGNPITITAVDDYAFSEAGDLEWVSLPESVKKVGYEAFGNCTALQGVIIESRDVIEIGNQAFDGCKALRFVASNAPQGVMDEDYDPGLTDTFETGHFLHRRIQKDITETSGLPKNQECIHLRSWKWAKQERHFTGTNAAGEPWLLSFVPEDIWMHRSVCRIPRWRCGAGHWSAYHHTKRTVYTVNWKMLGQLWIDSGAFYSSQLGGDITLSDSCYLASYAVYNCDRLTSVTMGDNIGRIGEGTFGGWQGSLITAGWHDAGQRGTVQRSVQ